MHTHTTEYPVVNIILDSYLLDQLIRKVNIFILPSFFPSLILFPSLCKCDFLNYIIFLLCKELLLASFSSLQGNQLPHFFASDKISISHLLLKDTFTEYRILGCFFPLSTLCISFYSLLVCMVSEKSYVFLILAPQ